MQAATKKEVIAVMLKHGRSDLANSIAAVNAAVGPGHIKPLKKTLEEVVRDIQTLVRVEIDDPAEKKLATDAIKAIFDAMGWLSKLSSVGASLHVEADGNIEDDTPIMPWLVAESVIEEVVRFATSKGLEDEANKLYDVSRDLSEKLSDDANKIYKANKKFAKQMNAPGDKGRDQLYVWMRHWLSAELKKKHPKIFSVLPQSFMTGKELH